MGNVLRNLCSCKYRPFFLNETLALFSLKANLQAMKNTDTKNQQGAERTEVVIEA